jgi:cation transport regulator
MNYASIAELPESIRGALPEKAQREWLSVFNSTQSEGDTDQSAIRKAWGAVKRDYVKSGGEWIAKIAKAEYQGREVELDKPYRTPGESKKFAVYVKDGDSVKIVRFGDPDMEIRRDDDEARANFRARHSCDTVSDKTSAAYWSCKMWEAGSSVSDMLSKAEEQNTNAIQVEVAKVDDSLGMVFGWAIVSEINGEPYYDTQSHYIPSDVAMKSFAKYMQGERVAKAMHKGERIGSAVFGWPMTPDIMKAMGLQSDKTGVMIAMKPDGAAILKNYQSGEWTGFSIGGRAVLEDAA